METDLRIETVGEHTEQELINFMQLELIGGSCSQENPFITGKAEIINVNY